VVFDPSPNLVLKLNINHLARAEPASRGKVKSPQPPNQNACTAILVRSVWRFRANVSDWHRRGQLFWTGNGWSISS